MPLGDLTQAWVAASAALPLEWVLVGTWLDPDRPGWWQAVARGPGDPPEIMTGHGAIRGWRSTTWRSSCASGEAQRAATRLSIESAGATSLAGSKHALTTLTPTDMLAPLSTNGRQTTTHTARRLTCKRSLDRVQCRPKSVIDTFVFTP